MFPVGSSETVIGSPPGGIGATSVPVRTFRRGTVSEWLVVAFVGPVVLGAISLGAGFGLGTRCTNVPGNGTLDVARLA